jgi:hypothetical protein
MMLFIRYLGNVFTEPLPSNDKKVKKGKVVPVLN